ncbi:MAG: hypothetical protein WCK98_04005 [bacterium]
MSDSIQNKTRTTIANFSIHPGASIVGFFFINFAVTWVSLLLKLPLQSWHFWLSSGLSIIFSIWLGWRLFTNLKALAAVALTVASLVITIGSFVVSLNVSQKFYDLSYDGQAYHGEAIIELNEGWNPIYERAPGYGGGTHSIWLNAYPKASWLNSVSIYKVTGNIESGKTI